MRELSHALVLGGSGFIGSWLVERLLDEGVEVTVLDRATPATPPVAPVRRIDADVTEESVAEVLAQVQAAPSTPHTSAYGTPRKYRPSPATRP